MTGNNYGNWILAIHLGHRPDGFTITNLPGLLTVAYCPAIRNFQQGIPNFFLKVVAVRCQGDGEKFSASVKIFCEFGDTLLDNGGNMFGPFFSFVEMNGGDELIARSDEQFTHR